MFPGDILLQVFDFCRPEVSKTRDKNFYNWWHGLVHVCQRWRQVIFTSPRRLNLQLLCTRKKKLDCWPQIPIAINVKGLGSLSSTKEENLLSAFEHSDRVCRVTLSITLRQLEKVVKMMLKPFPVLTHLQLTLLTSIKSSDFDTWILRSLPSGFLGGPTSGLQELYLSGISPPASPSILSSTSDLVGLHLCDLLMADRVSPKAMVERLAVMTKLESLTIEFKFQYPSPLPAQNFRARAILPTLTQLRFQGDHRYLEDLVAQLDTPQLFNLTVMVTSIYWKHAGLLRLLHSFDGVETLHVGEHLSDFFPPMLNDLSDELIAELLPALCLLNLEGNPQKFVKMKKLLVPFIEKRQSISRPPLTIVRTHKDFERLQAFNEMGNGYS